MENKIHQAAAQHPTAEIHVVMTEDELVKKIPQLNSARFFDELESTNDFAKSAFKLADLMPAAAAGEPAAHTPPIDLDGPPIDRTDANCGPVVAHDMPRPRKEQPLLVGHLD